MMTPEQFAALGARQRGFTVYILGVRKDEPHVPNESNPFPSGSRKEALWNMGQADGAHVAQDSEE